MWQGVVSTVPAQPARERSGVSSHLDVAMPALHAAHGLPPGWDPRVDDVEPQQDELPVA